MVENQCLLLLNSTPSRLENGEYAGLVVICVITILFALTAIIGNILVVIAIIKTPALHSPSYVLLFSLAISDLGVGFIVQPLHVLLAVWALQGQKPETFCTVRILFWFFTAGLSIASYLTIVVISFDRYLAVSLRLQYRLKVTMRRVVGSAVTQWIVTAIVVGATRGGINSYGFPFAVTAILIWVISFFITSFIFFKTIRIILNSQAQVQTGLASGIQAQSRDNGFNLGVYKRSVISMLYVYLLYLFCYLPIVLYFVFLFFLPVHSLFMVWYHEISLSIVLFNSSANPFLYLWRMRDLRKAVKSLLFGASEEPDSLSTMQSLS